MEVIGSLFSYYGKVRLKKSKKSISWFSPRYVVPKCYLLLDSHIPGFLHDGLILTNLKCL